MKELLLTAAIIPAAVVLCLMTLAFVDNLLDKPKKK